ncbi:MAG: hypothetical protein F4203_08010 [Rhodobacteraceae bacterium]|nr:hypothetical protein [Paracoccaceae bacterium]MDE2759805.1 hypothetical protein [Paracoccaceae bacterium]MDE2915603.1 hypothetical protein [Paracoccaceae bacterium]MYG10428.1 hypothetical protein [Paracoccaceae bacterium]MYG43066.1 hypothetical protein [Paracoccaceae bacterium]
MGIKHHKPILRSDKTTYRVQLAVRNEGLFYLSALNQIISWYGKPLTIRIDNSPEYISATLQN